jgi:SAM-dependent methyltransferase
MKETVVWHDLECHGYVADMDFWRELAGRERGPVLDVGAGTGRVSLDLAAAGHSVIALDNDPDLLAELSERARTRRLPVVTVTADAQDFALDERFGLVIVPMQTIQLLADRAAFLRCAAAHLDPGGLFAAAIADDLVPFDPHDGIELPDPDTGERDGWAFSSQPVAVRVFDGGARIDRVRRLTAPDGTTTEEPDTITLTALGAAALARELEEAGLRPLEPASIAPTLDHVGSTVVMARA